MDDLRAIGADEREVEARVDRLLEAHPPSQAGASTFLGAQYDLGLAWVWFDQGYGGLGAAPALQDVVNGRLADAGAPSAWALNPIGVGMAGPTLHAWADDALKRRLLRPLYTGEEIWCQLFSEPGAGSDVAGLSTRAQRDGDQWVVNGQKVWTSLGHLARWGLLLARSNPDAPKHRGLSYFVIDMHDGAIDVRPLRQMTGEAEFNEVWLNDLRIDDDHRLGGEGDGWRVAITTLMNERVAIGGSSGGGQGPIHTALALWAEQPPERRTAPSRAKLAELWIEHEVVRLTVARAAGSRERGTPGPEGSTAKLASAELNQRIYSFCVDLLGADGMLYGSYDLRSDGASRSGNVQRRFLRSRANTIEGGTSEIMRNILAERLLGLPGDIRGDKDVPWNKVPRNS